MNKMVIAVLVILILVIFGCHVLYAQCDGGSSMTSSDLESGSEEMSQMESSMDVQPGDSVSSVEEKGMDVQPGDSVDSEGTGAH